MDDDTEFEPRLGRMRSTPTRRVRSYLGRVLTAANLARGGASAGGRRRSFTGGRNGRAAGVGCVLAQRNRFAAARQRRVVVKARIVKLGGKGAAGAAAHLRYLQRDGTTREGDPGRLYGRDLDELDSSPFHVAAAGDRHQFRLIVSPEDGADYDDLKPLTRRLMARVEEDLGTRLDWVAVDHFNTGHPHMHILMRGKDERGADLVIARAYLTSGIRERAAELIELDLGPRTLREVEQSRRAEVRQERLTSLDRSLLRDADMDRMVAARGPSALEQALRAGRLAKLARLGLAEQVGESRWRLAEGLEEALRAIGERGDIIRTMQREFSRARLERAAADRVIYDPAAADTARLVGRVVARGFADEFTDRHFLIVDATDGRSHYVAIGKGEAVEPLAAGTVVEIVPRRTDVRSTDRTVSEVAAVNGGRYDADAHLRFDPSATQAFAETHVRRLESLRRGGVELERDPTGIWTITADHLDRVAEFERAALRDRPVSLEILSARPVEQLVGADAATWLDREAISATPVALRDAGFGRDVRIAQERRRQWLISEELAGEAGGVTTYRADLLATLQRRELLRVAAQVAGELDLPFVDSIEGSHVEGVLRRPLNLVSGRFAIVERTRDFTLVPWRPVLERQMGKRISGIMRESGISWTLGRGRSGPSVE